MQTTELAGMLAYKADPLAHYSAMADEAQRLATRPQNPARWAAWLRGLPEGALRIAAAGFAADLATIEGHGLTPQNGSFFAESFLGDANVLVECEHEGASGDGWNEPHYDESITPICALINGVWVDADQFSEDVTDRWQQAGVDHLAAQREADLEDRAAAQHADRMERCE